MQLWLPRYISPESAKIYSFFHSSSAMYTWSSEQKTNKHVIILWNSWVTTSQMNRENIFSKLTNSSTFTSTPWIEDKVNYWRQRVKVPVGIYLVSTSNFRTPTTLVARVQTYNVQEGRVRHEGQTNHNLFLSSRHTCTLIESWLEATSLAHQPPASN
jgi:hypothetical protein